jgi:hypothetical protein
MTKQGVDGVEVGTSDGRTLSKTLSRGPGQDLEHREAIKLSIKSRGGEC